MLLISVAKTWIKSKIVRIIYTNGSAMYRDILQCIYPPPPQDSPTNKLLYAKEIPEYKKRVQCYYRQIQEMAPLSEQEMNAHLAEESRVSKAVTTYLCCAHRAPTKVVQSNHL